MRAGRRRSRVARRAGARQQPPERAGGRDARGGGGRLSAQALLDIPVEARAAFLDLAGDEGGEAPPHEHRLRWEALQRRHGVNLSVPEAIAAYGGDRETQRAIAQARLGNLSPDIEDEVEAQIAFHEGRAWRPMNGRRRTKASTKA